MLENSPFENTFSDNLSNIELQILAEKEKNSANSNLLEAKLQDNENEENSKIENFPEELKNLQNLLNEINSNISYYDKFVITLKISNILKDSSVINKISLLKILEKKMENRRFINKYKNLVGNMNKFPQINGKSFFFFTK